MALDRLPLVDKDSGGLSFVDLSSTLLTVAMLPLIAGVCLDTSSYRPAHQKLSDDWAPAGTVGA